MLLVLSFWRLCLSITDFHPDTWNPAWSVSTILTGLLSFMVEKGPTLGSIETSEFTVSSRLWDTPFVGLANVECDLKVKTAAGILISRKWICCCLLQMMGRWIKSIWGGVGMGKGFLTELKIPFSKLYG